MMVQVDPEYGYCVMVGIASGFMLTWKSMQVVKMRKLLKINYPTMYSQDSELFNCYQRAHHNTLENYPLFLMLLFSGGLYNPVVSALGGATWVVSRIFYALGYYTGEPKKRMRGSFGYLGIFAMLYCSIRYASRLVGWF